jgi:hypothetical protein
MCAWRNNEARSAEPAAGSVERRALGLLLEGAAINLPQIDTGRHRRFRSGILRSSIAITQPQSEPDLLGTVATVVHEFESYRTDCEAEIESRHKEWRQLAAALMHLLAARDNVDQKSELWAKITSSLVSAGTADQIEAVRATLQKLFRLSGEEQAANQVEEADEQDRSTANDNAAGLRGGGAAMEHVRSMIASTRPGYVGIFRLNCLDVVGERFGPEGIQDCLMTVSAILIQNMRSEDSVYHWSESSLLAVCDRKVREDILAAELNRVLARNRDFTINIGDRAIMLRIPIDLQLYPISHFANVEDLQNLFKPRRLPERAASDRGPSRGLPVNI